MVLLLLAILFVLGLALLLVGLRGRAVDDHPLCRACGFDLTGRAAGSDRCAECGNDLTRPKAIRVGHRRRRGALAAGGAALLLVSLAGLGLTALARGRAVDPTPYKPTWWVLRDLASPSVPTSTVAFAELVRRHKADQLSAPHQSQFLAATLARLDRTPPESAAAFDEIIRQQKLGKLSADQRAKLVARALAQQADAARPWDAKWGDLIESMRQDGAVSDADWAAYGRRGMGILLEARAVVRQGDPLPISIKPTGQRLGSAGRFELRYQWESLHVGDRPISLDPDRQRQQRQLIITANRGGGSWSSPRAPTDGRVTAGLPLGPLPIRAKIVGELFDRTNSPQDSYYGAPNDTAGKLGDETLELAGATEIVPADRPDPFFVGDPALRPAIEAGLAIDPIRPVKDREGSWRINIRSGGLPVGLVAQVFLRAEGVEKRINNGTIQFHPSRTPPGSYNSSYGLLANKGLPAPDVRKVDLILRPDLEAAKWTADTARVWGEEIVIKDVEVRPEEPTD